MHPSAGDKRRVLAGHEFFSGLPDAVIDRLAAYAHTVRVEAGRCLFRKGDEGRGLLAVLSGLVRISVPSEEGREIVRNLIGAGEVFGEIALLDGKPRTADASALADCTLLVLERRDFVPVLTEEPALALKLLDVLADRLRRTSGQVEDLTFVGLPGRLAKALLRLARAQGAAADPRPHVAITQKGLGDLVGLSRESTNRQLRAWEEDGLVRLERGGLTLAAPRVLARLAGEDGD